MKENFLGRFAASAFLWLLCMVPALSADGVIIKGVVKDKSSKAPLTGAAVRVLGTQVGAVTDVNGNFELGKGLSAGTYDIVVKYIGYKEISQKVIAGDTNPVILDIELERSAQKLSKVVVAAKKNRENENILLLEQKKSVLAVQSVGVKELSRKGVSDAEGAVTKVSGVSKQDGVKNVFVRGLGDRYNVTTFNGFALPSEDPEYKNIS
ncbi:MAG TPA: hypothetical protein DEQ84_00270, partial [Prevotellaceae bacterium]|nr:hypothetical protein [Prevotellaceae bacterium]